DAHKATQYERNADGQLAINDQIAEEAGMRDHESLNECAMKADGVPGHRLEKLGGKVFAVRESAGELGNGDTDEMVAHEDSRDGEINESCLLLEISGERHNTSCWTTDGMRTVDAKPLYWPEREASTGIATAKISIAGRKSAAGLELEYGQ